ncbi:unnamed protein product [Zymoseptoria tritici ST99CH_1E4]|uniref:Uncharacterized protein n=1 Tax=Zymoseptoria tritici ST99CH_1E4 TaxID=1276532 RepID=A0A2H1HBV3_ZYMTR|nr:unnamed protein product [Zymoseptoria tritici ST99CH_1E4]
MLQYQQADFQTQLDRTKTFLSDEGDRKPRKILMQSCFHDIEMKAYQDNGTDSRIRKSENIVLMKLYDAFKTDEDANNVRAAKRFWNYLYKLRTNDHFALILLCSKDLARLITRNSFQIGHAIALDAVFRRTYVMIMDRKIDENLSISLPSITHSSCVGRGWPLATIPTTRTCHS